MQNGPFHVSNPIGHVRIDVHKKMCQAVVLDEDGELLDQIRFLNEKEEIKDFAMKLLTFRDDVKAVVESTGNLWIQIHDILEKFGFEVFLSNPTKTRLIAEAKNKTDKVDAKILARLLRADMLFTCYVPGEEKRNRRELLRYRLRARVDDGRIAVSLNVESPDTYHPADTILYLMNFGTSQRASDVVARIPRVALDRRQLSRYRWSHRI